MEKEKVMNNENEVMDEFAARDKLREDRKKIKSFHDLATFLKDVENNYNYEYGVAPRSIAQACLAVGWYLSDKMGITSFQAGCVMWDFICDWNYENNKCGLKIIDYDNMLYPQYRHRFEKTIDEGTWRAIQEQAKKNLERDNIYTHPDVLNHWRSIVNGEVPFGYKVVKR